MSDHKRCNAPQQKFYIALSLAIVFIISAITVTIVHPSKSGTSPVIPNSNDTLIPSPSNNTTGNDNNNTNPIDKPSTPSPTMPQPVINPEYCHLNTSLDPNLLHITCPRIHNNNNGFAMDRPCRPGMKCTYACEPPFVSTINAWSNNDCVPYKGRCDQPYDPYKYHGGLVCSQSLGAGIVQHQNVPLCKMGLKTAKVVSNVPENIASCQTVYPGNESPMIGFDIKSGDEPKFLTSFPRSYWHSTHAHFYIHKPGSIREDACQWNYDKHSLNSGGVDFFPFIIGGGAAGRNCESCGQHNMDFGENFNFEVAGFPSFGIKVRNCKSDGNCGNVICDARYYLVGGTNSIVQYWLKYNTRYGKSTVGCVAPAVSGSTDPKVGYPSSFTKFEYYSTSKGDIPPSSCEKIKSQRPARVGRGYNPAMFICHSN